MDPFEKGDTQCSLNWDWSLVCLTRSAPYLCVPFFVAVWFNGAVSFGLVNVDGTLLE